MADADSDSDSSFVLLSEGTSVGSDSESFVIVSEDCVSTDSGEDLFGESQNELEKVVNDVKSCDSEDDQFCDSQQQLEKSEDDNSSVSTDSDEVLFGESRHQLKKLVDYSSSESVEVLLDCSGSLGNRKYVATNEFHRYPCKRIGHVCGDDCYEFSGEKKASENIDINDVTMEYVLPFLPAKTLCRFRSVGKQWDKWISTPFFIHKQAHSFRDISGFFSQLPGEKPSFVSLNRDAYGIPNPSLDFLPESITVRTTCNGLLCCESCDGENTYYICNPVNKQWTVLPKNYEPESGTSVLTKIYHGPESVLALAFETSVLEFAEHFQLVCAFSLPDQPVICFDIYSSRSRYWKRSKTECCEIDALHLTGHGLFLKGMVFWETLAGTILAFNLKEEQYGILPLPCRSGPHGVMAVMYGELCYILPVLEDSVYTLKIYGDMDMKLKHIIRLADGIFTNYDEELRALACVNDDVVIVLLGMKLIAYHVKAEKADIIQSYIGTSAGYAGYLPYVNSLVQVNHP
ncbi:PREDICTED: uncharacterized protein LOC101305105 [Fragaria vesca subsp. vesca]|uniref:uncharacterized protein LOC101305105 n=1 Tax=Fragaria vesca subsp. vesca TaxID=101020 RepID=UPI0002C368C4|nr:PREDICTED: uncharacterized protein LOC101305105 [Fragaria vesca subsp. vesca]XP_011462970.1 PREDICTED: uncharacterized protein LOC101305105 [Fragaria vesca subsp. vesca]